MHTWHRPGADFWRFELCDASMGGSRPPRKAPTDRAGPCKCHLRSKRGKPGWHDRERAGAARAAAYIHSYGAGAPDECGAVWRYNPTCEPRWITGAAQG